MSEGYIQITRELINDPNVRAAPIAQRWILITILEFCCFKPKKIDDHGVIIDLLPGQCMITLRSFAEYIGAEKNDVERAIARFSKVKILRQEVRHKKTIITALWGIEIHTCETTIETKVRQERDTNEERKNETPSFSSFKKETNKERKVVRPAFRSPLLHEEDINAMAAMTELNDRAVQIKEFSQWLKTHDLDEVSWCCGKMLEAKSIKKTPSATIQWFLSDRTFYKEKNIESNRIFSAELKIKYNLNSLTITKQYARDENTKYDFQFWWENEMFERTILGVFAIEEKEKSS